MKAQAIESIRVLVTLAGIYSALVWITFRALRHTVRWLGARQPADPTAGGREERPLHALAPASR